MLYLVYTKNFNKKTKILKKIFGARVILEYIREIKRSYDTKLPVITFKTFKVFLHIIHMEKTDKHTKNIRYLCLFPCASDIRKIFQILIIALMVIEVLIKQKYIKEIKTQQGVVLKTTVEMLKYVEQRFGTVNSLKPYFYEANTFIDDVRILLAAVSV